VQPLLHHHLEVGLLYGIGLCAVNVHEGDVSTIGLLQLVARIMSTRFLDLQAHILEVLVEVFETVVVEQVVSLWCFGRSLEYIIELTTSDHLHVSLFTMLCVCRRKNVPLVPIIQGSFNTSARVFALA
jgi:hypothetical protein